MTDAPLNRIAIEIGCVLIWRKETVEAYSVLDKRHDTLQECQFVAEIRLGNVGNSIVGAHLRLISHRRRNQCGRGCCPAQVRLEETRYDTQNGALRPTVNGCGLHHALKKTVKLVEYLYYIAVTPPLRCW